MQANRARDTAPELALRRRLHALGVRYRVDLPPLPGLRRRADIVFPKLRVALFVDGCFWHGCPDHGPRRFGANADYWTEKIVANRSRDADTNARLKDAGWTVLRYWEHCDPEKVAAEVLDVLDARRADRRSFVP